MLIEKRKKEKEQSSGEVEISLKIAKELEKKDWRIKRRMPKFLDDCF